MMADRTIVIVGATGGIGRVVAKRLAAQGERVIAAGRDATKAASLRTELGARHTVLTCDVSTVDGCARLVDDVSGHTDHIDVLINNAGLMTPDRRVSQDAHELNFAVHHLAPFAVTSRAMPLLRKGSVPGDPDGRDRPRVVNTNSAGHQHSLGGHVNPTLDFTDLESERAYDPFLAYSRSKLANLLFTYELVRRHGDELLVSALHPGQVRTDIGRHFPRWRVAAAQITAISPERGAPAITALAVEPVTTNGGYYDRSTLTRSSPPSYDADAARRLWEITEGICGPFTP
jgi:NAD(P)-dependent dehydrogenase (short-subunit alcohol dehydrogenase family)